MKGNARVMKSILKTFKTFDEIELENETSEARNKIINSFVNLRLEILRCGILSEEKLLSIEKDMMVLGIALCNAYYSLLLWVKKK